MSKRRGFPLATVLVIVSSVVTLWAQPVEAGVGADSDRSNRPLTVAVIGDVPYGVEQEASFDHLIEAINSDPKVRTAVHVGDIKSGSTECTDERFAAVRAAFDRFEDPLVFTPGDNEWTDCHRPNNGGYNPLERLAAIRSLFFAQPGSVLGSRPMQIDYQPSLVENVRWVRSKVAFATLHVVGSGNGRAPWTGETAPTPEQEAEVDARTAAALAWVDATFDQAVARDLEGVVLAMQADTFESTPPTGFEAIIERIATRTAVFAGQVLLLQGDSHQYTVDNPLGLPNFTRVVVHGETLPFEYLRLTVRPGDPAGLFTWDRVPVPTT